MDTLVNQIFSPDVTPVGAIVKLLLALLLGAGIGMERRYKGQIAGMRTFALIGMGACLAMLISIYIPQQYLGLKNGDPGRIAAQVVSGVGFLGAGAIIQMKGAVRGLTTAAGIWMTACIGLAVGAGMYLIAIVATLLIIIVLVNSERSERHINFQWESRVISIKAHGIVDDLEPCRKLISEHGVRVADTLVRYDYDNQLTTANFLVRAKGTLDAPPLFHQLREVVDAVSITLTNEMDV